MDQMEDQLATVVERVLERDEGRVVGPRTVHDYNDGVRWSVDLTYDKAEPAVALELTTVQDDAFLSTNGAFRKLAMSLSILADEENLGSWDVTAWDTGRVRTVRAALIDAMRHGETIHTDELSVDDIERWELAGDLDEQLRIRHQLESAGVTDIERSSRHSGVSISTAGSSVRSTPRWPGVSDVQDVVASNAKKIQQTGLEGHLAIGVGRFHVSRIPTDTAVPSLPLGVDRVWLVRLWIVPGQGFDVWSAMRGDAVWTVHEPVSVESTSARSC